MSTTVPQITSLAEFKQLLASGQTFVIHYVAAWSEPTQRLKPDIQKVASSGQFSNVKFFFVDTDARIDVTSITGLRSLPTIQLFKGGVKVDEIGPGGRVGPTWLEDLIKKHT